jgi:hypothetical protein
MCHAQSGKGSTSLTTLASGKVSTDLGPRGEWEESNTVTDDPNEKVLAWLAVVDLDLQIYKASIYKLRWLSPGGLDQALLALDEARRIVQSVAWPLTTAEHAEVFTKLLTRYTETLKAHDHTTASAQQTALSKALSELRNSVRLL